MVEGEEKQGRERRKGEGEEKGEKEEGEGRMSPPVLPLTPTS